MGVDRNVYFGYFLKCQNEIVEILEKPTCKLNKKIKSCPLDKLVEFPTQCDECSETLNMVSRKTNKVEYIDPEEIDEDFYLADHYGCKFDQKDDKFFEFYMPNKIKDVKFIDEQIGSGNDQVNIVNNYFSIEKGRKQFYELYSKSIEVIKEKYGNDNVEICFGIIRYSS